MRHNMFVAQLCEDSFKDGFLSLSASAEPWPYLTSSTWISWSSQKAYDSHDIWFQKEVALLFSICFAKAILERQTA